MANNSWQNKKYFDAAGWFLWGVGEGLSFGILTLETIGAKNVAINAARMTAIQGRTPLVNQGSKAVLINGYYEVNGFRFSEYYYNKLWSTGRGAPSIIAKEVLQGGAKNAVPDVLKGGFNKYTYAGWEMIYNPITKEVWHLQPIK